MKNTGKTISNISTNISLLRVVCTLLIISLHIISQSGALGESNNRFFLFSTIVSSAGRTACTVFVMISAYFLVNAPFRMTSIVKMWIRTILIVSLGNILLALFLPQVFIGQSKWLIISQFFPIIGKPYWYIQTYIFMLIFSPVLNFLLKQDNIRHYFNFLIFIYAGMILLASIPSLYNQMPLIDNEIIFFCFIYCFIGRIKPLITKNRILSSVFFNGLSFIIIYSVMVSISYYSNKYKEIYPYAWTLRFFYTSHFQTIFSFLAATNLFLFFINLKNIHFFQKTINLLGSQSGNVYLFHQVPSFYFGDGWNTLFRINHFFNTPILFPLYFFFVLILTYIVGVVVGLVLDKFVSKIMRYRYIDAFCNQMNIKLFADNVHQVVK